MRKPWWIAISVGALLTLLVVGVALAQPPAPTKPFTPNTPPAAGWDDMREWMDSQFGEGFFDRMHGSYEGMTETCNTMMGSGGMMGGGMMGGAGMMGGGMMRPGTGTSRTGVGNMMGNLMGDFGSHMRGLLY